MLTWLLLHTYILAASVVVYKIEITCTHTITVQVCEHKVNKEAPVVLCRLPLPTLVFTSEFSKLALVCNSSVLLYLVQINFLPQDPGQFFSLFWFCLYIYSLSLSCLFSLSPPPSPVK